MKYNDEVKKALETLKQNGYFIDIENAKIYKSPNAKDIDRDAIEVLERAGYWIDLKEGKIKDVAGIRKDEKIKCLQNDSIENKLAVMKHIKDKYKTPGVAEQYGYPLSAMKHAMDIISNYREHRQISSDKSTAKTYVCSDIHGMYGSYKEVMKGVNESDTVYILGDVIDRGKGGIKILQDIMKRPNVKLFMGNHEWMMLRFIETMRKYNINTTEGGDLLNYITLNRHKKICKFDLEKGIAQSRDTTENERTLYEMETRINQIKSRSPHISAISERDLDVFYDWTREMNGGKKTFIEYMKLSPKEQNDIYDYLNQLLVAAKITHQNQKYMFVHAAPIVNQSVLEHSGSNNIGIKYCDIHDNAVLHHAFEERNDTDDSYRQYMQYGFITICGHTYQKGTVVDMRKDRGILRIDAGCGHGGKLALYCMENDSVEYFNEKEFDKNDIDTEDR